MSDAAKKPSSRDNSERIATWVDSQFLKSVRVYSSVKGESIRQIIEKGVIAYMEANPVTDAEMKAALDPGIKKD